MDFRTNISSTILNWPLSLSRTVVNNNIMLTKCMRIIISCICWSILKTYLSTHLTHSNPNKPMKSYLQLRSCSFFLKKKYVHGSSVDKKYLFIEYFYLIITDFTNRWNFVWAENLLSGTSKTFLTLLGYNDTAGDYFPVLVIVVHNLWTHKLFKQTNHPNIDVRVTNTLLAKQQ